jgi:hypothetical protein
MKVECRVHGELLDADDGFIIEATAHAHEQSHMAWRQPREPLYVSIRGHHSTHHGERTCERCDKPLDNGCYGSHFPCGFDFEGKSLMAVLEDHKPTEP